MTALAPPLRLRFVTRVIEPYRPIPCGQETIMNRALSLSFPALVAVPLLVTMPLPTVAATIVVGTEADIDAVDGVCSLREAILAANADLAHGDCPSGNGADRIEFDLSLPAVITLTEPLPAITAPLAIRGPGGSQLAIDGDTLHRPLTIDSPTDDGWVLVEGLSLTHGRTPAGDDFGGAAAVSAGEFVMFRRVRFIGNRAENGGGGLSVWSGTASPTTVFVVECLFTANAAEGPAGGGGFFATGEATELTIFRSVLLSNAAEHENGPGAGGRATNVVLGLESTTISGNTANSGGGGLSLFSSTGSTAMVTIRNSTITDNSASADGLGAGGGGLGILSAVGTSVSLFLANTVVAGNHDSSVVSGPEIACPGTVELVSAHASFVASNAACESMFPAGTPNVDGAFVGTAAAPLDALLGPLSDHGGPTFVHRPLPTSPLIDQGSCISATADQRGYGNAADRDRPVDVAHIPNAPGGDACDIGAFEVQGDPGSDWLLFGDGFEVGHPLLWHDEVP